MEDLAQTVMDQLRVNDGASPFVALATWKNYRTDQWYHVVIVPVTNNGTMSYNVETLQWTVYRSVDQHQFDQDWKPEKLCNFATVEQAAQFLMSTAKSRHHDNKNTDLPYVPFSIGTLTLELINKPPMELENVEGITHMIEILAHMRPPVEV
jgi:hypothetical protein